MFLKKKIFNNYYNYLDILIILIPFSIIMGNYVLNLNLLFIIVFGSFKYIKEIKELINTYKYYFLFFLIFTLLNLFFSENLHLSIIGSIGLIKNICFSILLFFWLRDKKKNFKNFSISITLAIITVSISVLIQFFYYEITTNETINRINGLFYDESVAGSYIVKLLIPAFIYLILELKNVKIELILFILSFFAVLITGDRAPAILYFLSFFIFIFFNKKINLLKSSKLIIILISISLITFSLSNNLRNKITYTSGQLGFIYIEKIFFNIQKNYFNERKLSFENYLKQKNRSNENNFFETEWFKHYSKAFEIGKQNIIIGSGIKTFRNSCKNPNYTSKSDINLPIDLGCATHPHNIYIEIFSETGTVGITLFIFLIINIVLQSIKITDSNVKALLLSYIFILFFPIQTTGSFFSTFNGIFYFICLGLVLHLNNYYKSIK